MTALAWTPAPKPTDSRLIDLTGEQFGRLQVIGFAGRDQRQKHIWTCACLCGATTYARADHLRSGAVVSCGCWRVEATVGASVTHGATRGAWRTPEYRSWKGMRERCSSPRAQKFRDYGGRGIAVCARWRSFENFLSDMGPRPRGTSIERNDVNGNYEPGNCRWATSLEQARNRRNNRFIEWGGARMTVSEWAAITKLPATSIIARLDRGWSTTRTLTTSIQPRRAA